MEEEGIYYYFEHKDWTNSHRMIIADKPDSHRLCPSKSSIDFVEKITGESHTPVVTEWSMEYQLQTGRVEFRDHQFQLPNTKLEAEQDSRFNDMGNQNVEVYEFPGGYARKFDQIDKGGGDQAGELQKVFQDNKQAVQNVIDALDAKHKTYRGRSDCSSFTAGYKFKISHLPEKDDDREYALTTVRHFYRQSPPYASTDDPGNPIQNQFECIPLGDSKFAPFRPQRTTPKPSIFGSQTAYVVGPSGEEIHVDKYGRVKVQFHWDREGKYDAGSSCWMRVAQGWAGNNWGSMFIPRIGMEVLVQFLEGDPDQPLITGCVYNPSALPPYKLPDDKTRTIVFKSNSSKGGRGFNEIRVEDKKGEEQVFFHAEKNQDVRVKNDNKEWIGQDTHLIVKRDQIEQVQKDKHLLVKGDQTEKVDGNVHLRVGSNKEQKIGTKFAVDSGMEVHLKAGMSVTIEAGSQITLKAGGSFVNVGPTGVAIKGAMVMLNSGGAAGSGGGASPGTPKDPLEADTAQSGKYLGPRPPNPPAPYVRIAEEARAKVEAEEEAKREAVLASLPKQTDVQRLGAVLHNFMFSGGVSDRDIKHESIVSNLSEAELEILIAASKNKKDSYFVSDPNAIKFYLTKALEEAKKKAGQPVRQRYEFPRSSGPESVVPPAVIPQSVAAEEVKQDEARPANYSVYGEDKKEEMPANYSVYGEDKKEEAASQYVQGEGAEEKDVEESAANYQAFKEDEGPEERKDARESAANYQAFKEDEGPEEDKDIGQQAVSMVDATKDGVPYVTYTD